MAREKKERKPINWKKEAKLTPGYLILIIWVLLAQSQILWDKGFLT